ncbi:MAG TPA: recombination mediator RecR [Candidatus Krumholzibacteria bacterium]|nr:recombination mediator RecR [Candidatus Krumholzibacteria bacterium]HPD72722.1 recombination mediator RecR [Candidatus Krumholzibacteria bacterium]HRY40346.1 recombination mediator RecR [Candidatus Krumholzibacteria bacterium]
MHPGAPGGGRQASGGEFQSPALERLVRSLQQLPGLGRKSATRIALHLLANHEDAAQLTTAVDDARRQVTRCGRCGAITESDPCAICTNPGRDASLLCVVASPVDILPFEKAAFFRGRYFVLGRLLSPLDGVRAEDLPFDRLRARIDEDEVREVILALDTSVEGETTALYVQRLLAGRAIHLSRLATGIPVGGALAYTDEATLQRAFQHRTGVEGG